MLSQATGPVGTLTASMQIRNQISKNNTEQGYLLRVVSLNATMQLVFLPVSL